MNERDDFDKYLRAEMDDLFKSLVTQEEIGSVNFDKDGLLIRGKEIFHNKLKKLRNKICMQYHENPTEYATALDSISVLSAWLVQKELISCEIAIPFTVIVVRYGLNRLCPLK